MNEHPLALSAGELIYVSGISAPAASQAMSEGNDVGAQTRRVLERLGQVMASQGGSLQDVAAVTVYLPHASDFQAMNDAYRTFWPKDPPTRTTVIATLLETGALVEMSAIAVAPGRERTIVHPADWMRSPNPYSYAIRSGETLFLSGLVSRNGRDNSAVPGDIARQTRTVLDNAGELLRAGGLGFEHVACVRVFLPDRSMFAQMNAVYAEYFPEAPPARATVPAGLAGSDYLIEMTIVACAGRRMTVALPQHDGARLPLSAAIQAGTRVYVSGTLGHTAANGGDTAAQTRETLARIGGTLEALGISPGEVVDSTVFLADGAVGGAIGEPWKAFFEPRHPASTVVTTGLIPSGALVEIMVTAEAGV